MIFLISETIFQEINLIFVREILLLSIDLTPGAATERDYHEPFTNSLKLGCHMQFMHAITSFLKLVITKVQ